MATAIFLMLSGNSMEFTSHTVEGTTYQDCLYKVLIELGSPCMWEVYDHEVVKGEFLQEDVGAYDPAEHFELAFAFHDHEFDELVPF